MNSSIAELDLISIREILGFLLAVFALAPFALQDYFYFRLIEIEHNDFPDQWEKDGKPYSILYSRSWQEYRSLRPFNNLWLPGSIWLFCTPAWVKGNHAATRYLILFRLAMGAVQILIWGSCLWLILAKNATAIIST